MDERRQYERASLPEEASIHLRTVDDRLRGRVLDLGRGGLLLECRKDISAGDRFEAIITDHSDGSSCHVQLEALYSSDRGIGFRFHMLDVTAAVEIGVWIGRYLCV